MPAELRHVAQRQRKKHLKLAVFNLAQGSIKMALHSYRKAQSTSEIIKD
jgi:hypothetical protein